MPVNARVIKSKIKSVKSTRKITKAMEMIAAAKMRKATLAAQRTREFTNLANEIISKLSADGESRTHGLLEQRKVKKELILAISSNRGLCGNFNSALLHHLQIYLNGRKAQEPNLKFAEIATGKKASVFAKMNDIDLLEVYDRMAENISVNDILPIVQSVITHYLDKEFDQITLAYTEFESSLVQHVRVLKLLPITQESINNFILGENETADLKNANEADSKGAQLDAAQSKNYLFEPELSEVLDYALRRIVEAQLYQAFLESSASEHSSRMVAMKSASDAASDLIGALTLEYNKSRQASITQEISEISNAASAIR